MKRALRLELVIAAVSTILLSLVTNKFELVLPLLVLATGLFGVTSGRTEPEQLYLAQITVILLIGTGGFVLAFFPFNLFGELCLIEAGMFFLRLILAWIFSKSFVSHELSGPFDKQGSG